MSDEKDEDAQQADLQSGAPVQVAPGPDGRRSGWLRVMNSDDLPEGGIRAAQNGRHAVCLSRHAGKAGALVDECPHQGSPLSTGWLYEGHVVCPWHGWAFDAHNGQMAGGAGPCAQPLPIKEKNGEILVLFPDEQD